MARWELDRLQGLGAGGTVPEHGSAARVRLGRWGLALLFAPVVTML